MNEPLDTAVIEQRLRDQVPALQQVGGAAEYAGIKDLKSFRPGSAYVVLANEEDVPESDSRSQRRPSGQQQVKATIGVIVAARNYRDKTGSEALQEAKPLIGAVRTALLSNWIPGGQLQRPLKWLRGDVLDHDRSTLLWIDVFSITYFMGDTTS
ncbi:hypothetical protein ACJJIQ_09050 [Microbulbifer sp. ANSA003]|uniref:phage tail terminator protein n=1 Tax=Microbulbifer sp. ANSA003 TaxID=3243360 RepID=UPI004041A299